MSILIKKPGISSTVQDLGRFGYRRSGINPNGVMDRTAARLINILLGNPENAAVIEMHFPAAEIVFEHDCHFALGGAVLDARLDGNDLANWRVHRAAKGSVLTFNQKKSGNRVYLSVRGGFHVEKWLDSASTNLSAKIGGFDGRKLESGDQIEFVLIQGFASQFVHQQIAPSPIPRYSRFPTVRVTQGGEFDLLDRHSQERFQISNFQISNNSNRMGFRLSGEPLGLTKPVEMLSSAVNFGTIQLLPDGHQNDQLAVW